MSQANCFIVLEQDSDHIAAAETVTIESYNALID
ncbi:MAG TPA: hypothetical protein VIS54_03810 [Psychromonas sp.]